ncbi:DUF4316 domain-containing protein [bacterium 1xD42-67]|nr:DUF4316 domain-containing protein [bacterium 1xD42-67]
MADKKTNREKLKEITDSIEQGIKELFQSDKYAEYLRTMSRFHSYSVRNTILIHMQRPDATAVAGFNAWKNKFQRHVKKGEKGITILAPTPFKKKIEEKKLDPVTKAPMVDRNGNVIMEEKEIEIPMFRPVKVFDVSQTEGKPLPQLSSPLTGEVQNYEIFMEALRRTSPVPIAINPIREEGVDGFLDLDARDITVKEGMGQMQTVRTTIHEIAHAVLHLKEQNRLSATAGTEQETKPKDRNTKEVEAESVSYAVCQYFGLQTGEYSFGYIAGWSSEKSLPELKASLETISRTANQLINDIDRHFKEICKERGVDLTQPEQAALEAEVPAPPVEARLEQAAPKAAAHDSIEQFSADLYDFLDNLYQTGVIEHPATLDSKVQFVADIAAELNNGYWEEIRFSLLHLAEFPRASEVCIDAASSCAACASEAKQLLDRLYVLEKATPKMVETLREAADRAVQAEAEIEEQYPDPLEKQRDHIAAEDDALWDTVLDEYPMPDPAFLSDELEQNYGYMDGDLLPLSKERAAELLERDLTIYAIVDGGQAEMVFDRDDLDERPPDMVFGVPKEEWEASPDFHQLIADRMNHQEERERAFLDHGGDCFAIYQIKDDDPDRLRFMDMDWLTSQGLSPDRANYELAYTGEMPCGLGSTALEKLYQKFNTDHPADYHRPSMSVSDILAVKQDGVVSCHYCNSIGFARVPDFLQPENYLKNAEMSLEDDLGMIDGIINNGPKATVAELEQQARSGQPISLIELAAATHREEQEKKQSVRQKLKNKPRQKRTAPKRSAERDR